MKIKINIDLEAGRTQAEIVSWLWEGGALQDAAEVIGHSFFENEHKTTRIEQRLRGLRQVTIITGPAKNTLPGVV